MAYFTKAASTPLTFIGLITAGKIKEKDTKP